MLDFLKIVKNKKFNYLTKHFEILFSLSQNIKIKAKL